MKINHIHNTIYKIKFTPKHVSVDVAIKSMNIQKKTLIQKISKLVVHIKKIQHSIKTLHIMISKQEVLRRPIIKEIKKISKIIEEQSKIITTKPHLSCENSKFTDIKELRSVSDLTCMQSAITKK